MPSFIREGDCVTFPAVFQQTRYCPPVNGEVTQILLYEIYMTCQKTCPLDYLGMSSTQEQVVTRGETIEIFLECETLTEVYICVTNLLSPVC